MAVAFDAASNSTSGTTNRSWTHTPVGTPRAAIVTVVQSIGATDEVTSVTYGGTAMTEMTGSPLLCASQAETGAVYAYFLGSSVPTGAQTVVVNVNGTGSSKNGHAVTLTASADTQITDTSTSGEATGANPSVVIQGGGTTNFYGAILWTGANSAGNVTLDAGNTSDAFSDMGNDCGNTVHKTSTGTGDQTISWTIASLPYIILGYSISETGGGGGGGAGAGRALLLGVG